MGPSEVRKLIPGGLKIRPAYEGGNPDNAHHNFMYDARLLLLLQPNELIASGLFSVPFPTTESGLQATAFVTSVLNPIFC